MIHRLVAFALLGLSVVGFAAPGMAADGDVQLIRAGHINQAITQLQERVKNNPSDAESLNLLARAYYSIEQWDDAIASNQRALKLHPDSSDFHTWMGRAYGEKAETVGVLGAANLARKTKSEFEKAVQLNPSATQARLDLAEYYIEAPAIMGGGMDKARDQADATARFDLAASHLIRARIAQQHKDYDEAVTEFKAAIASARNPANYWINIASFYESRGRLPEMERAITTAMSLPGRQPGTLYDGAAILYRSGRNYPGAVAYLRQYLSDERFDEDAPAFRAHYLLGELLEKMQKRADAIAEYRTTLSMASDFKKAQSALDRLQS